MIPTATRVPNILASISRLVSRRSYTSFGRKLVVSSVNCSTLLPLQTRSTNMSATPNPRPSLDRPVPNLNAMRAATTSAAASSTAGASSSSSTTTAPSSQQQRHPSASSIAKQAITLENILTNSDQFLASSGWEWPSSRNRIRIFLQRRLAAISDGVQAVAWNLKMQKRIEEQAKDTKIILHASLLKLLEAFLQLKQTSGSTVERALYGPMNVQQLILRLIAQRPIVFFLPSDYALLRNGQTKSGGFHRVGTDAERAPLLLADYLSYDEMAISAMISVSLPTFFINSGGRTNTSSTGRPGTYLEEGIIAGTVGARLEKEDVMEWKHMVITDEQNTEQNGYGAAGSKLNPLLALWAQFYGVSHFPTYAEAVAAIRKSPSTCGFLPTGRSASPPLLNIGIFKKRLEYTLIPFLLDADLRAKALGKKAYARVTGIGLGVWMLCEEQAPLMVEVYRDIFSRVKLNHIANIEFVWFQPMAVQESVWKDGTRFQHPTTGNDIDITFRKSNPADPLPAGSENKLLVTNYAWDGNSYPGNEYYIGQLAASADPAAACSSFIAELQNPMINPFLTRPESIRILAE